jgi:putative DNA primase/helicase
MTSHNPPREPTQRRKLLREVKKLARVALAPGEASVITTLRLKTLSNGYVPISSRDKRAMLKGWNELAPDEAEIRGWLNERASLTMFAATGLLVVNELATLDNDVPDSNVARDVRAAQNRIAPQLFEAHGALERGRDDGSPKLMLFCRRGVAAPFTIRSQKWSTAPEQVEAPTFQVEVFSSDRNKEGKAARQVGAFGPHTVDDESGAVKIRYQWRGPSPADVPLADLPVLTEEQALAICTEADQIFARAGLQPLKGYHGGRVKPVDVYDLDDNTRFDGEDFANTSLAELIKIYWENENFGDTRCSGSFTGEGGTRLDRCQVGWSGDKATGHITVHDYATEMTHRPKVERPVPGDNIEKSIADLVELFKDLPPEAEDEPNGPFGDRLTAAIGEASAGALTEDAIARALARLYGDRLCYAPAEKQWLRFEAPRWIPESGARIETLIVGTFCHGIPLPRTPVGAKIRKQIESHRHYVAIERLLRGLLEYKDGFDKDRYLIAGPLLVINLRTGRARLGRPKDRIRLSMSNDPSPEEDCPRWKQFVAEITSPEAGVEDTDSQRLLQQWAGLGLCGDPTHQRLLFLSGGGRNGKGTWADVLVELLGNGPSGYALSMRFEAFLAMRYSEHSTELWAMKGKRMITASEVPKNATWNVQRIKDLTGNATVQARGMHQNFEVFARTWTLTLLGNSMPKFENVDAAIRARIRVIPFDRNFEEEGLMDEDLQKVLLQEAPGILRWAINGLLDVKAGGKLNLIEPERVTEDTNAYLAGTDIRMRFIVEHLEKSDTDKATLTQDIFAAWKAFAEANEASPHNQRSMSGWLVKLAGARRGPKVNVTVDGKEKRGVTTLIGIKLRADALVAGDIFEKPR